MRGKVRHMPLPFSQDRITPAYAGKSPQNYTLKFKTPDHPRLCGEKLTASESRKAAYGSPPPMRGKAVDSVKPSASWGITPAYAGKRCKKVRGVDLV